MGGVRSGRPRVEVHGRGIPNSANPFETSMPEDRRAARVRLLGQAISREWDNLITAQGSLEEDGVERLLTSKEAAKLLNISERAFQRWRTAVKLPCIRIGRLARFRVENLMEAIERCNFVAPSGGDS